MSVSNLLTVGSKPEMILNIEALNIGSNAISLFNQAEFNQKKAIWLPRLTTVERNALTPSSGMLIFNTDINQLEVYENGVWENPAIPVVPAAPTFTTLEFTLQPADIYTLFSVPVQILPAPAAGTAYQISTISVNYLYGTIAYAGGGGNLKLQYATSGTDILAFSISDGAITGANGTSTIEPSSSSTLQSTNIAANAINFLDDTADFMNGDGVINLTLEYRIIASV